jgi:uncharacterized protein HemX
MVTKSKVKNKVKSKKNSVIKKSLITKGTIGTTLGATALAGLTGIGLLGFKMNKDKKNLQKELDKIKSNTSISDKKNIDSLKKCLLDIDNNEKNYKDIIEQLQKQIADYKIKEEETQKQITEYKIKEEETKKIISECKKKEEIYLELTNPHQRMSNREIQEAANIINEKLIRLFNCP